MTHAKSIRFNGTKKNIFCFSIHITGRCNTACTYCHYYGQRDKKLVWRDLDEDLFDRYLRFIKHWKKKIEGRTILRFSGGDPMVIGEKLFDNIDKAFSLTGIRPYILTAGKALDRAWVERAKKSQLSHVFVSLENPLNPDKGAPNPWIVMENVRALNSRRLPIVLGTMVVRNEDYKDLFKICEIVYKITGTIPNLSEVSYQAYRSPTENQLDALYENVYRIVCKYKDRCPINIFSYIVPELGYGDSHPYITDLDLDNAVGVKDGEFDAAISGVMAQLGRSYRKGDCQNDFCSWSDQCKIIKWVWFESRNGDKVGQRMTDYCHYKMAIMSAFYHAMHGEPLSKWREDAVYQSSQSGIADKDQALSV